jgi:glycosyltransferase involved in cell wall biosynthesis
MRIAYVCADRGVPVFGGKGASVHVQEVVRGFLERGADVELFASRAGGEPPAGLERATLHRIPSPGAEGEEEKERLALAANGPLRALLRRAGRFDLIYERHALWSHAAMEHAREEGVPGLLEVNAPLLEEQRTWRALALEAETRQSAERAFSAAAALLAVSEEVAAHLEGLAAARGRVHVVHNGVDPERFAPPGGGPRPARPFTAGYVGTLRPWHAVDDLVVAFAALRRREPEPRLVIVGDGPLRPAVEAAIEAHAIREAVELCGAVPPARVPALLETMDVAVAPYPPVESFYFCPLKIFEYMAAGKAIIAADIGGIRRLVVHGRTGLLYPPGDRGALARAIERCAADPVLRRRLGESARRVAVRDHTWHSVIGRILALAGSQRAAVPAGGRA